MTINFNKFKNQIGSFYPPSKIFINVNFLKTLPINEIQSGFGEMSHYFILESHKAFKDFQDLYFEFFNKFEIIEKIIIDSLLIKKKYIENDEFDKNERRKLNYGHTFGHAIESISNYKIPHGIAVSLGIDIANHFSVNLGFLDSSIRNEIKVFLKNINKDYSIDNFLITEFEKALSKDKKNSEGIINLILCKDYGNTFQHKMNLDNAFRNILSKYFN